MSEYCNSCSEKYRLKKESYPLFCEGCKTYFEKENPIENLKISIQCFKESIFKSIVNSFFLRKIRDYLSSAINN